MLRHHVDCRIFHGLSFQVAAKPSWRRQRREQLGFFLRGRTIVEIRRRPGVGRVAVLVNFDELQAFRDDVAVVGAIGPAILDGVLQV
jgi:hypothetical protein